MAKISLRTYKKEIENLIDRGQLEEAIAHCRHILSIFPKYVDAYRLLAKAFLESQNYPDAGDVFQRVLSVVPDDFVSHIGISIVKEDAGDLDSAIWHMERAFETQPSNTPIQQELKRLYGRRDGVEPQKIRLTKGVLVRMYAKSRLFPQAIAEIQAALAEDPSRTDLELILAQMFFESNQKLDATEIASKVVSKLPFCLEANRILSEVLSNTSRSEDAKKYLDRVVSLDPYSKFGSGLNVSSEDVPDNAITLDRLDWRHDMDNSPYPDLSLSDFSNPPANEVSTHLVGEESAQPLANSNQPSQAEDSIPSWMKTAGWHSSDANSVPEVPKENEQIAEPADIPDWLKQISPIDTPVPENIQPNQKIEPMSESQKPNKTALDNSLSSETIKTTEKYQEPKESNGKQETAEWLGSTSEFKVKNLEGEREEAFSPISEHMEMKHEAQGENIPEWLQDIKSQPTFETGPVQANSNDLNPSSSPEQIQEDVRMPWLDSITNATQQNPQDSEKPSASGTAPWLDEIPPLETPEKFEGPSKSEELPEWLREIEITPEGEESLKSKPQTAPLSDQIPNWLQDLKTTTPPEPKQESSTGVTPSKKEESPQEDLKDWLSSLEPPPLPDTAANIEKENNSPSHKYIKEKTEDQVSIPQLPKTKITNYTPGDSEDIVPPQVTKAEKAIESNNLHEALDEYRRIIKSGSFLPATIQSIQKATEKFISEAALWQLLGDAFAKNDQLREALEAYNSAERCLG
jgi:tetratricopeptide (TPR) repeat protein